GVLLRFLETGELQKVGSDTPTGTADVRIISATNRRLESLIEQGLFRDDLFYRLNVICLWVPALRERRSDIPLLVEASLERFTRSDEHLVRAIAPEAMQALCEYGWPGNVRELQNVIERLVVTGRNEVVGLADLPLELRGPKPAARSPQTDERRTVADQLYR